MNNVHPYIVSPFLKKLSTYIKKEHYSNFLKFEIAGLPNVPGHYLRKYGSLKYFDFSLQTSKWINKSSNLSFQLNYSIMQQKVFIDNARELFCDSFLILPNVSSKRLSTIEMILSSFSQELAWVQQQVMLDIILLHLDESSNDSPVIGFLPMFVVKEYEIF